MLVIGLETPHHCRDSLDFRRDTLARQLKHHRARSSKLLSSFRRKAIVVLVTGN
jgi:hypothetical protein